MNSAHQNGIDGLVSIIMPAYNAEKFIKQSIGSVLLQTYDNFELLVIDDCSNDQTVQAVRAFDDERVKLIQLLHNSGAAKARNEGIKEAKGEFMAFLDSDDLWTKTKLADQIDFMRSNDYAFTCTEYVEMDEQENVLTTVKVREKMNYNDLLKHCPGNSTVIYNVNRLGKFYAPDIKRRNDFALWLQVIKKAQFIYGLKQTYSYYRVGNESLSSNKAKLIRHQWMVLHEIEHLSVVKSSYLIIHKIISVIFKKIDTRLKK